MLTYYSHILLGPSFQRATSAVSSTCTPDMSAELSLVSIVRTAADVDYVTSTVMKNSI